MKQRINKFVSRCLIFVTLAGSTALAADPSTAPVNLAPQQADVAAPKMDKNAKRFMDLHESFLKRAKEGNIDLLFLGDSITEGWSGRGNEIWNKTYTNLRPANFGIGGDQTQHVLWRIDNGELDGINPKVLVLMIGTNNIGSHTAEQITRADVKIVNEIHDKLHQTKVLLLGIFPRDAEPTGKRRSDIRAINAQLAKLDDGNKTRYLDISDKFLTPDGVLSRDIMPDLLHPNAKGYQIWADAMQPLLGEMMK